MLPEWASTVALKLAGSVAGSGIAAWLRKSPRWPFHVVTGAWFGYVSGQWLLDYMGWQATTDYILLSWSIMGAVTCSILEGLFHLWPEIRAYAKGWLVSRAKGLERE